MTVNNEFQFVTCTEIATPHLDNGRCIDNEHVGTELWFLDAQACLEAALVNLSDGARIMGENGYPPDGVLDAVTHAIRLLRGVGDAAGFTL